MTLVERPTHRPEHANEVCNICGKPSPNTICDACADRVRADALDRKKHEEKAYS
jgi:recombinational DNA repair protein RecR